MNTLPIEASLAKIYNYKPLPDDLSEKYRELYRENIPSWLNEHGADTALYSTKGSLITNGYRRIVVGDYGAFIEFEKSQDTFVIAQGQEYRVYDERYSKNIKYIWLTIADGSDVKIYYQRRGVKYADYRAGMYYVSVHEVIQNTDFITKEESI